MKKLLTGAQVQEVAQLLNRWDPKNVRADADGPQDEYQSCLPLIVSLVQSGCSVADLTDHLDELRTERMHRPADRAADRQIAEAILRIAQ